MSSGPGSYTGLRIGLSTAKGVAYARNVPLIAVPTLKLITVGPLLYDDEMPDNALLVPMIDARRMEVYAAVYDRALKPLREVGADIVTADTYREWLDRAPVYFMGDGAEKMQGGDRSSQRALCRQRASARPPYGAAGRTRLPRRRFCRHGLF